MGVIYSEIYKNHFPLKGMFTEFTEQEKKRLCRWANNFRTEVNVRETEMFCKRRRLFTTYNLNRYNEKFMIDMIMRNCFNVECLGVLNAIINRHKYNVVLSIWLFPMINDKVYKGCSGGKVK